MVQPYSLYRVNNLMQQWACGNQIPVDCFVCENYCQIKRGTKAHCVNSQEIFPPQKVIYYGTETSKIVTNHNALIHNQRNKEAKEFSSAVYVTNESNQNLTPSQKELLICHFRLGHIGLKHVQWLIIKGRLKLQVSYKSV